MVNEKDVGEGTIKFWGGMILASEPATSEPKENLACSHLSHHEPPKKRDRKRCGATPHFLSNR
jgi:hypothetical protein